MTRENKPLDPEHVSACLEAAIRISNRRERERLQRLNRTGTVGFANFLERFGAVATLFTRSDHSADGRQGR